MEEKKIVQDNAELSDEQMEWVFGGAGLTFVGAPTPGETKCLGCRRKIQVDNLRSFTCPKCGFQNKP